LFDLPRFPFVNVILFRKAKITKPPDPVSGKGQETHRALCAQTQHLCGEEILASRGTSHFPKGSAVSVKDLNP